MLLSKQLPLQSLIEFCRVLRHNLAAGLGIRHVFRQQAERGPRPVRPVAERILQDIDEGGSIQAALKKVKDYFPPIFVSLVTVGEETGNLPEILGDLEKYFLLIQKLRRQFMSQIAIPLLYFFLAPLVIAGMIFFLAVLSGANAPFDPLGWGYTGVKGAAKFLIHYFGTFTLMAIAYVLITRTFRQREFVHELMLRTPALGPALQAIVLTRFCMALRLTMETGMSIAGAVRLSLQATGNEAYAAKADVVVQGVKTGDDLTVALGKARLFPEGFLNIMANAEEGGRVPEVMRLQGDYYEEEAHRKVTILTRVAGWGVYLVVGGMMVYMILSIAMGITKVYQVD